MQNDEWFFTKSLYKKSQGGGIPLKFGYSIRNIISASFKFPEVVIKIPRRIGNSKGLRGIKDHLSYISRNGKLDLETNNEEKISDNIGIKSLLQDWKNFGIPQESKRREALNIVLSMPYGTNEKSLVKSVREFAKEQFGEHQYVFVLHEDELHPHVHLCVMMKNRFGKRLNPRKADIQEWRIRFADNLRENNIACSATYRQHRGVYQKKENGIIRNIKKRGGISTVEKSIKENLDFYKKNDIMPPTLFLAKSKLTRNKIISDYIKVANSLKDVGDITNHNVVVNFINEIKNKSFVSQEQEKYMKYIFDNNSIDLDNGLDM